MEIVSVYNDKGGVGKTSIALSVATALAVSGKKVLLVDNDPQGSLSVSCAENVVAIGEGLDLVYKGSKEIIDILVDTHVDNLILAPAGKTLKDFYLRNDAATRRRVEKLIDFIRNDEEFVQIFDIVIIDNPPAQDGIAMQCTLMADTILIPVIPDEMCYDALTRTYIYIKEQAVGFSEKYIVIIPSLVKNRSVHRNVLERIKKKYNGANQNTIVSENHIKDRAEIPETIGNRQNIFISHAASEVAQQLRELCLDVFTWMDKDEFLEGMNQTAKAIRKARWEKFYAALKKKKVAQESKAAANKKAAPKVDVKAKVKNNKIVKADNKAKNTKRKGSR